MIKLSDYVIKFIESLGIEHVFMISGGGCMHLVDSIGHSKKIKYICNFNEQAVSIGVEAYGQFSGNIGVGLVTTGPGGTNAITGIAAAYVDSTPCLMISGQVKRADLAKQYGVRQMGFQEINITELVKPITKYAMMIENPNDIRYHLEKAVYLAKTGRQGPTWIDIPLDVQAAMIDEEHLRGFDPKEVPEVKVDTDIEDKVKTLMKMIEGAKRPCILVGNGVRLAHAEKAFLELVNALKIPVLATWKAIDFFDEHDPIFYGRPGAIGQRPANFIQQNCDLLLVIGARLDLGQTAYNHKNFAPKAKKIIVDIDEKEIDKLDMQIALRFVCSAEQFINTFLTLKSGLCYTVPQEWKTYCNQLLEKYPIVLKEYWDKKDYVNSYCFMEVLSKMLDTKDIVVPGSSGSCSELTMQAFKVKKGQRVFNNEGLGSMGFGLPASIAACIAGKGRRTVSIIGDGGFQFNIQELETLRRYHLPLKVFIFNNDGYGAITSMQRNHFNGYYVASEKNSGVTMPDSCEIASAYGIKHMRINNNAELEEKLAIVLNNDEPYICDLMLDPMQQTMPRTMSVKLPDGSMESKPMEDLWPFLSREELESNMLK